jgi:HlyD family secretion protein
MGRTVRTLLRGRRTLLVPPAAALVLYLGISLARGPRVEVMLPRRQMLVQSVVASGRVYVQTRVQVGPVINGMVSRVAVREGDRVAAGDLLIQLEDSEERAGVAQAEARLRQLREVESLAAEEALRQSDASFRLAEQEYQRVQALMTARAVPQQELDRALETYDLAGSRRLSAAVRAKSQARGGADDRLAEAGVAAASARLSHTCLRASGPGRILSRMVQPGDVVQAGETLLVLGQDGDVQLSVQPEEKSLAFLSVGQLATASADAFPDSTFAAQITEIAPAVDASRGTVEVRLFVPRAPSYLRPDMTVSVNVEVGRRQAALILPAEAIHDAETRRPWVLLVERGRTVRRPVTLGMRGDGVVEMTGGVQEGSRVVPVTAARIGEGRRVRARDSDQSGR